MPDDALPEDTLPEDTLNERVGVLTRREIEARILKPFIAALSERFGADEVQTILAGVVKEAAKASGQAMNRQTVISQATTSPSTNQGESDLQTFAEAWEPWFRGGALEIQEFERTSERWSFNVTRCRYAELYRALGMAELGATLSCNRDAALIEGFGPNVKLERTQTLMEGASYCDFRYRRESE